MYGNKKEEGFFLGNNFIHVPLGISFEFSDQFYFINRPNALIGRSKDNAKIIFDLEETNKMSNIDYVSSWLSTPKKKIINYKSFSNADFKISSGEIVRKKKHIFFATLNANPSITFRFVLINDSKNKEREFINMIKSFKKIAQDDIDNLNPPKIRITSASSNPRFFEATVVKSKLQKMFADDIHRSLNNLKNDTIEVGEKVKTIY